MAATRIIPRPGNDGSDTADSAGQAVRLFTAMCDGKGDTPYTIMAHPDVPQPGDAHPDNSSIYVTERRATQEKNGPHVWRLEIFYSASDSEVSPGSNPLNDPPQYNYDVSETEIVLYQDLSETPKFFVNVPFSEPLLEPPVWIRGSGIVTISRNEASFDSYGLSGDYLFTVCQHELLGWPAKTGLMRRISGTRQYHSKLLFIYYTVIYGIHFRSEGWHEYRRNLSSKYYDSSEGSNHTKAFGADDGISDAGLGEIKENGRKFDPSDGDDEEDRHILDFQGYPERDWYALSLE